MTSIAWIWQDPTKAFERAWTRTEGEWEVLTGVWKPTNVSQSIQGSHTENPLAECMLGFDREGSPSACTTHRLQPTVENPAASRNHRWVSLNDQETKDIYLAHYQRWFLVGLVELNFTKTSTLFLETQKTLSGVSSSLESSSGCLLFIEYFYFVSFSFYILL